MKKKMIINVDDYLKWVYDECDNETLSFLCYILKNGCKPYEKQYIDTNILFDGRYISEEYILNKKELFANNLIEKNKDGDILPKTNIEIQWI